MLNPFLESVSEQVFDHTLERIRSFCFPKLIADFVVTEGKETMTQDYFLHRFLYFLKENFFKPASASPYKLMFDIESSMNLWIDSDFVYCIPYFHNSFNLVLPDYVEDFSYWNNTDKPEEVTNIEWEYRNETWHRICLNDWNIHRLQYDIVDVDSIDCMIELERMFLYVD